MVCLPALRLSARSSRHHPIQVAFPLCVLFLCGCCTLNLCLNLSRMHPATDPRGHRSTNPQIHTPKDPHTPDPPIPQIHPPTDPFTPDPPTHRSTHPQIHPHTHRSTHARSTNPQIHPAEMPYPFLPALTRIVSVKSCLVILAGPLRWKTSEGEVAACSRHVLRWPMGSVRKRTISATDLWYLGGAGKTPS